MSFALKRHIGEAPDSDSPPLDQLPRIPIQVALAPVIELDVVREAHSTGADDEVRSLINGEATEEARKLHIAKLYRSLGANPEMPLPDHTVTRILNRFPAWDYQVEGGLRSVHRLTRAVAGSWVVLDLPHQEVPRRMMDQDDEGVALTVSNDVIRARDLQACLLIEAQYPHNLYLRESKGNGLQEPVVSEAAARLAVAKGIYEHEDDLFTDTQKVVLSCLVEYDSPGQLAKALNIPKHRLNKILQPLYARLGNSSEANNIDPYIELTLAAIALGEADASRLPTARAEAIKKLTESEREFLGSYYHAGSEQRTAYREQYPDDKVSGKRWSRIYQKLGIQGRHATTMAAVASGLIKLPSDEQLAARFTRR